MAQGHHPEPPPPPEPPSNHQLLNQILTIEQEILAAVLGQPVSGTTIHWAFGEAVAPTVRSTNVSFSLGDTQKVTVTAAGTDAKGSPTNGKIVYAVDDPVILSVTDNGDGTAILAGGNQGKAILSATDTDADGNVFTATIEIDVVAGDTAAVAFSFGTPTAQ